MPKLRLVQERRKETVHTADIRGLGDTELFQKSGIHVHLAVTYANGPSDEKLIEELCDAYHLVSKPHSSDRSIVHLGIVHPRTGEHLTDALKLFVAALELSHKVQDAHLLIFPTSGLRALLRERVRGEKDGESEEIKSMIKPAMLEMKHTSKLCLHSLVAHAAHQAGLIAEAGSAEWVQLSDQQLQEAHTLLLKDANADHSIHKVTATGGSR